MFATLYRDLLKAFVAVLNLHIRTKTTKWDFHKASEPAYEALFDAAHAIAEKSEDMNCPITSDGDLEAIAKLAYDTICGAMEKLKAAIAQNEDPGMDNLLRSEYDKLQFQAGSMKGFCKACTEVPPEKKE